jgi:hypothetical protein
VIDPGEDRHPTIPDRLNETSDGRIERQ